jgi:prepilin-type N-terminal cleavage/methylation domain-containing protein
MKNEKGFTLIELLVVILIIGILLAIIMPNFAAFQERARQSSVKNNMHVYQTAMESYAVDHFGNYIVTWDDVEMSSYFPGGDPIPTPAIEGNLPVNPYTSVRYLEAPTPGTGTFAYYPDEWAQGAAASQRSDDPLCPYLGLAAVTYVADVSGAILIGGYTPDGIDSPSEYGICAWGKYLLEPIFDRDPASTEVVYFVLHN